MRRSSLNPNLESLATHARSSTSRFGSARRLGVCTAILLGMALFSGCGGTTSIKSLLDDPSHHDQQNVRIQGHVTETIGVAGYGAYRVDDGTGTITVVSKEGGAPRRGAEVGVRGKFHSAFTLGTQTLAVVVEDRRSTR